MSRDRLAHPPWLAKFSKTSGRVSKHTSTNCHGETLDSVCVLHGHTTNTLIDPSSPADTFLRSPYRRGNHIRGLYVRPSTVLHCRLGRVRCIPWAGKAGSAVRSRRVNDCEYSQGHIQCEGFEITAMCPGWPNTQANLLIKSHGYHDRHSNI